MHITVAICTWNRCALLERTLECMTGLAIPADVKWELLIVDNNCTDDTVTVAGRFATRLPVRIVREPQPGLSHARNTAIQSATGSYIVFTDDDVLVDSEWLAAFAAAAGQFPAAAAFGGPIHPWFAKPPDNDLLEAFPELQMGFCGLNYNRAEGPLQHDEYVYGANMAFRRSCLDGLKFNEHLGPTPVYQGRADDDVDFVDQLRRRAYEVIWVPRMRVQHYVDLSRMTLGYLLGFLADRGRTAIRSKGIPEGTQCFGVPRWLIRRYFEARARSVGARLVGHRVRALGHLRQSATLRGMIFECRRVHRERVAC